MVWWNCVVFQLKTKSLIWASKYVKIKRKIDLNYIPLIDKVQKKFNAWLIRDLSLTGRILLSKAEGLSRLAYTAMVLDAP